ncbi:MAG: hypothetical protein E7316_10090 [Clostridiales bacterium]|nr:hypothetical protein [Clostridiales bacterium]
MATLIVALLMAVMAPVSAMAANGGITTPTDLAPVASEKTVVVENASNVTETPKAEPIAEPVAEPTPEPVAETPAPAEKPVEIPEVEPAAESKADPAENADTTDQPDEEPTESLDLEPAGSVTIILRTAGPLYYGDEVALGALVNGVDGEFTLTWQAKVDADKWVDVGEGYTYKFILSPENANLEYRVVLNVIG